MLWLLVAVTAQLTFNNCSTNCTDEMLSNFLCDEECNTKECLYDNFDCSILCEGTFSLRSCLNGAAQEATDQCDYAQEVVECYEIAERCSVEAIIEEFEMRIYRIQYHNSECFDSWNEQLLRFFLSLMLIGLITHVIHMRQQIMASFAHRANGRTVAAT